MSRSSVSNVNPGSNRGATREPGTSNAGMLGLLLASIAISVLAAMIPYAFIASAALIGAMLAVSFLKQNVSAGLFWVMLASLVILVLGTAFGMISTLFLTPADAMTLDSAAAVPDFG